MKSKIILFVIATIFMLFESYAKTPKPSELSKLNTEKDARYLIESKPMVVYIYRSFVSLLDFRSTIY